MSAHNKSPMIFWSLLTVLIIVVADSSAQQATELSEINLITDTHVSMATNSGHIYASDDDVIVFDVDTTLSTSTKPLSQLDHVGIDGYHNSDVHCGDAIYSLDNSATINGNAITSADVFLTDGTVILNANDLGIPKGVNVNALSRVPGTCEIIFSIDTTTTIDSTVFTPSDLISWNGVGSLELYHTTGIEGNIDALHVLNSNRLLVSFDVSTTLIGLYLHNESIIEIILNSNDQILAFEPLVYHESWAAADLSALAVTPAFDDLIFINGFEPSGF